MANHEGPYGAPMAALRLASGLRAVGHDVSACFLYRREAIRNPYHPFETLHSSAPTSLFQYFSIFTKIVQRARQIRPQAVITFMPLAGIFGNLAASFARVPTRIVSHRAPVTTYTPVIRSLDWAMALLGVYSDVVAVSTAVRESCEHYPGWLRKRSFVVHNGLLEWRPSGLTRSEARSRLGLSDGEFVLIATGRLEAQKNFSFLLPVLARLKQVSLFIAGEGSLRDEFEKTSRSLGVDSRVRLLGTVPHAQVPDILNAGDLFVQPSLYEGQSNSLLEALHAEIPVVSSDIPEQVETIAEPDGRVAGAFISLNDPDAWVRTIERFRQNPDAMDEARKIARLRARVFSFERMIAGFEDVLAR